MKGALEVGSLKPKTPPLFLPLPIPLFLGFLGNPAERQLGAILQMGRLKVGKKSCPKFRRVGVLELCWEPGRTIKVCLSKNSADFSPPTAPRLLSGTTWASRLSHPTPLPMS